MPGSRSIHLSVHIHKNPAAMAERAAHIMASCCEEAIAERGVFNIALSLLPPAGGRGLGRTLALGKNQHLLC